MAEKETAWLRCPNFLLGLMAIILFFSQRLHR